MTRVGRRAVNERFQYKPQRDERGPRASDSASEGKWAGRLAALDDSQLAGCSLDPGPLR
jgi:hypothetical protein